MCCNDESLAHRHDRGDAKANSEFDARVSGISVPAGCYSVRGFAQRLKGDQGLAEVTPNRGVWGGTGGTISLHLPAICRRVPDVLLPFLQLHSSFSPSGGTLINSHLRVVYSHSSPSCYLFTA